MLPRKSHYIPLKTNSLLLLESLKLKGEENYRWKERVEDITTSNELSKYIHSKYVLPKEVDESDEKPNEQEREKWLEHRKCDVHCTNAARHHPQL